MPGKDTELENDQVISFILWKLEIVYQCNGDSQLIKLGDQIVYRDWDSLEMIYWNNSTLDNFYEVL